MFILCGRPCLISILFLFVTHLGVYNVYVLSMRVKSAIHTPIDIQTYTIYICMRGPVYILKMDFKEVFYKDSPIFTSFAIFN